MQNNQAWNETFGDDDEKKAEAMEEMAWRTACSSAVDDFPKFEECIRERHPNLRSNHPPLLLSTVCTVTVIGAKFSQEGPLVIFITRMCQDAQNNRLSIQSSCSLLSSSLLHPPSWLAPLCFCVGSC